MHDHPLISRVRAVWRWTDWSDDGDAREIRAVRVSATPGAITLPRLRGRPQLGHERYDEVARVSSGPEVSDVA
jgi:hypothetical protein